MNIWFTSIIRQTRKVNLSIIQKLYSVLINCLEISFVDIPNCQQVSNAELDTKDMVLRSQTLLIWAFLSVEAYFCTGSGRLWPKPQKQSSGPTKFRILTDFQINYKGARCEIIEKCIQRHFAPIIGNGNFTRTFGDASDTVLRTLEVSVASGCSSDYPHSDMDESYHLEVTSGTSILNSSEVWGALRGIETFTQLVHTDTNTLTRVVMKTSITDYPRFKFRAFMIDTARHYLDMDTILTHLDAMEATKYNVLHWHLVDDQSFPYQSEVFPDLSGKGAYDPVNRIYTPGDIKMVLESARLRGIRVMPEFDTPGHTLSWGKGYPSILSQCINEQGQRTNTGPLEPRFNATYDFVRTLFKEVIEVFPDDALFLGGDEVFFGCWESNQVYQDFIRANNLDGYAGLESFYIRKLLELVKHLPKNRTPIVWQEVFDNDINITEETIVNIWKTKGIKYQKELARVTAKGFNTILSAPWYLNYISHGEDWQKYYQIEPTDFVGSDQQRARVVGCEACMWGEYVDSTNFLPRSWPRAATVAERAWSSKDTTDLSDAFVRLHEFRCKLLKRGIPAEPLRPGDCDEE